MWQGMGECDKAYRHLAGESMQTHGRGWGHVSGCGGMWQGVGVMLQGWRHATGRGV